MAEALARRGHDVHVVTYHLGKRLTEPPFVVHRIGDIPSYRHTAPGPTWRKLARLDPLLVRLLRRLHGRIRFDVVHGHHYEGLLVASAARARVPIVYDAHTTLGAELPHYRIGLPGWLKRGLGARLDRRLPGRADHVIAVSESIRQHLVAVGAVAPERIHVIPNGVDWQRFRVNGGTDPNRGTIIFTGNLAAYQGVELLIEAFASLRARKHDARLLILTESSFEPYEKAARELGVRDAIDVRDVPFEETPALLAAAAVAVSPRPRCDGIPQKLLNYMAAGTPIVAFDGSAVHLEHERTGLRVPDGDTAAMGAAIERLLDDPHLARQLGDAARDQVRREFHWDGVASRVERVYREAIAGSTSSSGIGSPAK